MISSRLQNCFFFVMYKPPSSSLKCARSICIELEKLPEKLHVFKFPQNFVRRKGKPLLNVKLQNFVVRGHDALHQILIWKLIFLRLQSGKLFRAIHAVDFHWYSSESSFREARHFNVEICPNLLMVLLSHKFFHLFNRVSKVHIKMIVI